MAKDSRTRNYATVFYPESCPDDWLSIIGEWKVPVLVSPLHDQDINPTGEAKKPHYHLIICFEGKKSVEQVKELFDQIGAVGVESINSLRGYARYLCHLDNPDKHQYNPAEVISLSGIDYHGIIGLPSDRYQAIGEMMDYCRCNNVYSYAVLLEYSRDWRYDWFKILCDSGTIVIREFLKSLNWEKKEGEEHA